MDIKLSKISKTLKGNLTSKEWLELVSLDYILTFNYTNNFNEDLKRYLYLSNKR